MTQYLGSSEWSHYADCYREYYNAIGVLQSYRHNLARQEAEVQRCETAMSEALDIIMANFLELGLTAHPTAEPAPSAGPRAIRLADETQ